MVSAPIPPRLFLRLFHRYVSISRFFVTFFSLWSSLAFTVGVIAYVDDAGTLRVVLHVETRVFNTSSIGWSCAVSNSYIKVESQQVSSALALAGEK